MAFCLHFKLKKVAWACDHEDHLWVLRHGQQTTRHPLSSQSILRSHRPVLGLVQLLRAAVKYLQAA